MANGFRFSQRQGPLGNPVLDAFLAGKQQAEETEVLKQNLIEQQRQRELEQKKEEREQKLFDLQVQEMIAELQSARTQAKREALADLRATEEEFEEGTRAIPTELRNVPQPNLPGLENVEQSFRFPAETFETLSPGGRRVELDTSGILRNRDARRTLEEREQAQEIETFEKKESIREERAERQAERELEKAKTLEDLRQANRLEMQEVRDRNAKSRLFIQKSLDDITERISAGLSPEAIEGAKQQATEVYLGLRDLPSGKEGPLVARLVKQMGGIAVNPEKADNAVAAAQLTAVLQDMEDLIRNNPEQFPEGIGRAALTGNVEDFLNTLGASEFHQRLESLFARAGRVHQTISGESASRISDQDVVRAIGAMLRTGLTEKEAQKRLDTFRRDINLIINTALRGVPKKQKEAIINSALEAEFDVFKGQEEEEEPQITSLEDLDPRAQNAVRRVMQETGDDFQTAYTKYRIVTGQ